MISVVIPTVGRPSLGRLLDALIPQLGDDVTEVIVVDDRRAPIDAPLDLPTVARGRVTVLAGAGRGPAAARNAGWRAARGPWIAFIDDDVITPSGWVRALVDDLRDLPATVGASQGRIVVPLPERRRPTDWERNTAGLQDAAWATADMAYRRELLETVGGFDERFGRAFREDADLALRCQDAGAELVRGRRHVVHPVRPAGPWVSVRMQAGNADDALMTRLHGRDWHARAQAPRGRFRRHAAVTGAALAGVAGLAARRRLLAGAGLGAWIAGTAEFAAARIAPGPRTAHEVATMVVTSAVIPPAAVGHALRGRWRWRTAAPWPGRIRAVLFDRDGTLVHDVPYNGDPGRVAPVADAAATLRRLRDAGLQIGVISNQSGVGRGLISPAQVDAVNRAVEAAVGPIDTWQVCPHTPEDGCRCRKPAPGLVVRAAQALGVDPWECVVVGDIGSDVEAARNAGAAGLLVPTAVTRAEEVEAAPVVAGSLAEAADVVLRALADGRPIARAGRAARPPAVVAAGATATGAALAGAWSA